MRAGVSALQCNPYNEYMISGIDNAPEAREIEPALTTVAMDYPEMAAETIHLINDLLAGKKREQYISVPAKILYRESCGCMSENDRKTIFDCQNHYRQTADLVEEHTRQTFFKIDMAGCHNFNEMMEMVVRNLHLAGDCSSFYLCLLGKRDRNGIPVFQKEIPDKAEVILGWKNGKVQDLQGISFDRAQLLPPQKQYNEPQAFFLTMRQQFSRRGIPEEEEEEMSQRSCLDRNSHPENFRLQYTKIWMGCLNLRITACYCCQPGIR